MRLLLLAVILFLALTLGNAFWLNRERAKVASSDYAVVQVTKPQARKYEWDAFVWREIGALVITVVVFGFVATMRRAP